MENEQAEEIVLSEESLEDEREQQEPTEEEYLQVGEKVEAEESKSKSRGETEEDRSSFIHGLSVGLGMGCIATFIIMWVTVFFSPRLPSTITYESMLAVFIYPLLYLLAVGLVALTAGIVREYYRKK